MVTRRLTAAKAACLMLVMCGAAPTPAVGSALWANGGNIRAIDVATGAVGGDITFTGVPVPGFGDLAGEEKSQGALLWGVSGSGITNRLSAVDMTTLQVISSVVIAAPESIVSLAIDPVTADFYGASTGNLYRLAPATGVATLIGSTPLGVGKALGFDLSGNLYGIANENQLVTVNKATGATSLVATLPIFRMEDLAVRPETGVMYGIGYGPNYSLYQINLATGALTNLGPSYGRPNGLAFTAIPEPAAVAMAILAMIGLTGRRRRCRGSAAVR